VARSSQPNSPDTPKNRLFTIALYLTPVLLIILLELVLRLFNYGGNQSLFVTGPEKQISQYWMCGQDVSKRYFFMQHTKPSPPKDLFLKQKPENGYRIFVLGGSTTAGFPYGYNIMFPRILNFRLNDIFPDKQIEVVNTAMSAVNSYTLLDFMDEILAKQPDVLLIYAGHNEFYGALGVGSTESLGKNPKVIYTYLKLRRFKTFLLIRDFVGLLRKGAAKITTGSSTIDPSSTLMARIVAEQTIPYKSKLYELGMSQYRENLHRIFTKAQKKGVPIIISELVSNIKDQPPFVSVKADTFPTAAHAYEIGKKLEVQQQYQDARTALYYAKDLDALRFRAAEEMNNIVHEVAAEFNAPVVPIKDYFEAKSEHGLIGHNLIVEHLHPNVDGYFVMADAFLHTMKDNHFISDRWDESRILPSAYYRQNWGITELDTVSANLDIQYLRGSWPFQPQGQPNRTLDNYFPKTEAESLAVRILTDDKYSPVVGHADMAKYYEKKKEYNKAYEEYKAAYYMIPFELDFYKGAVENLLKVNRPGEAQRVLQHANRYVHDAVTDKWSGTLLAGSGKFAESLPYLERAAKETPEDKKLQTVLMHAYEQLGKADQASKIAEKLGVPPAAETNKNDPSPISEEGQRQIAFGALIQQAQKLIEKKDYRAALQFFKRAHSIRQTPLTFKWVGLLEVAGGNLTAGVEYLDQAFEMMPEDFEIAYNLCHANIKLKHKEAAKKVLDKMESLRPNFKDPQNLRGQIAKM
jgi:tetratricopeptide (TPR) repeat protein